MYRLVHKILFLPLSATYAKMSMMTNDGMHSIVCINLLYKPAQDLAQL